MACDMPRDSVPRTFQWQGGQGQWYNFDPAANTDIAEAFWRGQQSVRITTEAGAVLAVDLVKMQQTNQISGRQRPVRDAAPRTFQWQGGRGQWYNFDPSANKAIAEAFCRGQPFMRITTEAGADFVVDLVKMQQTSHSSGRQRPVRDATDILAQKAATGGKVCKYFTAGFCKRGASCCFEHGPASAENSAASAAQHWEELAQSSPGSCEVARSMLVQEEKYDSGLEGSNKESTRKLVDDDPQSDGEWELAEEQGRWAEDF